VKKSVLAGMGAVGMAASTQIGHCTTLSRQGHHEGMMCGGGGGKIGGRGARSGNSSTMQIFASIDHGS
jgi:hypothetical protein